MGGCYGDMLSFFPELMHPCTLFSMQPKPAGGFYPRTDIKHIKGIVLFVRDGKILEQNDTIAAVDTPYLWCREKIILAGFMVEDDNPDDIYRVCEGNPYKKEGGFWMYMLQNVVGNTDTQTDDISVDGHVRESY